MTKTWEIILTSPLRLMATVALLTLGVALLATAMLMTPFEAMYGSLSKLKSDLMDFYSSLDKAIEYFWTETRNK